MTEKDFFSRIKNNNYDFSKTRFINISMPIEIICKKHGLFSILPSNLLYKNEGCKFCGLEKMSKTKALSTSEFIEKANNIHYGKYDYSLVNYINNKTPVQITCKVCVTTFWQLPCNHLKGFGHRHKKDKLVEENSNGRASSYPS